MAASGLLRVLCPLPGAADRWSLPLRAKPGLPMLSQLHGSRSPALVVAVNGGSATKGSKRQGRRSLPTGAVVPHLTGMLRAVAIAPGDELPHQGEIVLRTTDAQNQMGNALFDIAISLVKLLRLDCD